MGLVAANNEVFYQLRCFISQLAPGILLDWREVSDKATEYDLKMYLETRKFPD